MTKQTPSAFARHLEKRRDVMTTIIAALRGEKLIDWGSGAYLSRRQILREIGVTLVTKTQIKKRGYVLHPRSKPIGQVYFDRPISRSHDVYILEVHCSKHIKPAK